MNPVPLLPGQPVTQRGDAASQELLEVIQRLVSKIAELETRLEALEP